MCGRSITSPPISSYNYVMSLTGLKITVPLCLLLCFMHNRIPCNHNAWAADNLAPLDMLFLCIIAQYNEPNKSKNLTSICIYYLLFVKRTFIFTLRKPGLAKTGAPGLFPLALLDTYYCLSKSKKMFNQTEGLNRSHK